MKFTHANILALLLSAATLLNGCTKEIDNEGKPDSYDPTQPVSFVTQLKESVTRGTPVNDAADLTTMGVFCAATENNDWSNAAALNKMFDQRLNRSANKWSYEGSSVYWDAEEITHRYSFFAYAPYASANNGLEVDTTLRNGKPALRYAVPIDVARQPDLMLAVPRYNILPTGGYVRLQMQHALTCVGFQLAGDGEQVTAISVSGVAMTGEVRVDGSNIAWTNLGEPTTTDFSTSLRYDEGQDYYTVTEDMSAPLLAADGYLMMIPQTLGSNAKIKVSLKDGTAVEVNLNSLTWEVGQRVSYSINLTPLGSITLTPSVVTLPSREVTAATDNVEVMCQKNDGTPHPNALWTLTSSNPEWLRLSLDPAATFGTASATVTGRGPVPVYTCALENGSGSERTTAIYMEGVKMADVKQLKQVASPAGRGTMPTTITSYIGAFWRAAEQGERVIQINVGTAAANLGAWSVWVDWVDTRWGYDGFALLPNGSTDPNIYSATPGEAEDYKVSGSATALSGTVARNGSITFRIGLRKPFASYHADHSPARYAVLLLAYGTPQKVQKLFLRQGEGADYLMLNSDPVSTGGITTRTRCVRFAPYNLTATTIDAQVDQQGIFPAVNPSKFVDYPTQAGAFFQWSYAEDAPSPLTRYAYNPHNPARPSVTPWTGWADNRVWSVISAIQESCPIGYRRPSDGTIDAIAPSMAGGGPGVAESEMRQSLWEKPFTALEGQGGWNMDNTTWGYYADGFFDRRNIVNAQGLYPGTRSAVALASNDIAYLGRLFFNPLSSSQNYNASLFFPVAGYRRYDNGQLSGAGTFVGYWSATTIPGSATGNSATGLRLTVDHTQFPILLKTSGLCVRPVRP